jgi:hypothetical protein
MMDGKVGMLRHTLATLAYRGGKALRGAPADFATFRCAESTRTPGEILAHLGDLFDWAVALADGVHWWNPQPPLDWDSGTARFFAGLEAFDRRLASDTPLAVPPEQLFQGPIADALTHVGQIAMLRRMAGAPVKAENYFKAAISAGSVSSEQPPPRVEFD